MKKVTLLFTALTAVTAVKAQDLPSNPEPGKCYVRCTTPDIYENQTMQVQVAPAYKKLRVVPATYKTVTEQVVVKEASKRLSLIPAKYETQTLSYQKKPASNRLRVVPATFGSSNQTIEVKPAFAQWELGAKAPDCASSNPDDCRYWCYKGYPAQFTTIATQTLTNNASTTSETLPAESGTYTKQILVEEAKVVEEVIPAQYGTITKTVVDTPETVETVDIPAQFRTITKEVLTKKGGLTVWREVECSLVEYSALPINWNLGSATLTTTAKNLIDNRLMTVLNQNPGTKMEIASHTDARGSASSNKSLSERRAQAVVAYLASKGVNGSRLVANGYGETRLKNRCSDGVSCTESQHAVNRRTEFRLINN